jgi:phycobilisome rod-core linker protein
VTIPLLEYAPLAPNQRVKNFDVAWDESPKVYTTNNILSASDMGTLINVAYRQIFFHAFASDREPVLESQLRGGQITVRDFIRGLLLSNTYKTSFYDLNSNYRFVEHTVQKVLGRDVYGQAEKIAWSAVVMTKGIAGFVDDILNSEEYLSNFGFDTVPYHRRRILPSQTVGERPFDIQSPRYDEYYRGKFGFPQFVWQATVRSYSPSKSTAAGNPSAYLDMARSISPRGGQAQRISSLNIDIEKSIPRR